MQLFRLSKLTLTYGERTDGTGTWQVSGRASPGGQTSAPFTGSLTYSGDTLSEVELSVGAISLAGLADLSQLNVSYSGGSWTGTATIRQGTSSTSWRSGWITARAALVSGSLTARNVQLFGVLDIATFGMSYSAAPGSWMSQRATTVDQPAHPL